MIVMQGINGRALGQEGAVGVLQQGAGKDFNCKTACWAGSKAVEELFKQLQIALNRYAAVASFSPIYVDSYIGPTTVSAAQNVAMYLYGRTDKRVDLRSLAVDKETIAANALALMAQLRTSAETYSLPEVPAPAKPTVAEKDAHDEAAAGQQEDGGGGGGGGGWMWWVLGIVAVAGIGTVGYLTWKRNQAGGYEEDDYSEGPVRSVAGPRVRHSAAHMAGPRMSYARRAARS
ncbi:MAG: hypothetical protein A2583_03300 [Bdellovibrionales bacterium RIFOXYD1_FULL_53_11]|nr:MAG: hypothetical protein A2583_03300 [Bdellovibrionales bacterium RIFOXYD1_FULL_53_11]